MADIQTLSKYLGLMPDEDTTIAGLALNAAKAKAKAAGVCERKNDPYYDLFIYALAGAWYDNRNISTPGLATQAGAEAMQRLVNQFVLELRYKSVEGGESNGETG
ncbi:MAG: head-tail connector protein [Enterococcus lemanii]|jgi:hypothetical protein